MNLSPNNLRNFFSRFRVEKYPSQSQWRRFFRRPQEILTRKESFVFFCLISLFLGSLIFLVVNFYLKNTQRQPSNGGAFVEGLLGQPRFVNPIYAQASDVDRDLTELIFSGLMKYGEEGKIVQDLAESYEIKEEGKVLEVYLKENLFWSDGAPLTANDVIFTVKTIQNSDYKSPVYVLWLGVGVEKISDLGVRFTLRNPYGSFLENLTQKMIPEHIWANVSPENFPLTIYNLKPVSSGPYELKELKQDKQGRIVSLELVKNPKYSGKRPYLSKIGFKFYDQEEELIRAYQKGEIQGFSLSSAANLEKYRLSSFNKYELLLPRYFALFFNQEKSKILSDKNVRQALNYGTDKAALIKEVLFGQGEPVDSPILPDLYGFSAPSKIYQFDLEVAQNLLEKSGFSQNQAGLREKITKKESSFQFKSELKTGSQGAEVQELQKCLAKNPEVFPEAQVTGYFGEQTRTAVIRFQEKYKKDILEPWGFEKGTGIVSKTTQNKLNELCFPQSEEFLILKFSLATVNQPVLIQTADLIKEQWKNLGVEIEINVFDSSQLEKEIIKPRNYEILLFGNVLTMLPDPFAFWHSNQIKDPGLNLSTYQQKETDKLLEESRKIIDQAQRRKKLEQFQNILIEDSPAVFLYSPDYLYFVSSDIKGVEAEIIPTPSQRFSGIEEWYIKTKRVWLQLKKR